MENLSDVSGATECPICLDTFHFPTSTPCGHNFCLECLENLIKHKFFTVKCPICRSYIPRSGYKINKLLDDILKALYPSEYNLKGKIDDIWCSLPKPKRKTFHIRKTIMILIAIFGLILLKKKFAIKVRNKIWILLSKFSSLIVTILFGQYAVYGHMLVSNLIGILFRTNIVW